MPLACFTFDTEVSQNQGLHPEKLKAPANAEVFSLAGETGLEPATPGFGDRCSTN